MDGNEVRKCPKCCGEMVLGILSAEGGLVGKLTGDYEKENLERKSLLIDVDNADT